MFKCATMWHERLKPYIQVWRSDTNWPQKAAVGQQLLSESLNQWFSLRTLVFQCDQWDKGVKRFKRPTYPVPTPFPLEGVQMWDGSLERCRETDLLPVSLENQQTMWCNWENIFQWVQSRKNSPIAFNTCVILTTIWSKEQPRSAMAPASWWSHTTMSSA